MRLKIKLESKIFLIAILLTPHFLLFTLSVHATFEDLSVGARAMGMGGAFLAVADDATALFHNPAGMIQMKRPEIILTPLSYLSQRSGNSFYGFLGYVQPVQKVEHFGIGLMTRSINLARRYRENTLNISYSRALNTFTTAGLTLKMCSKDYPDNTSVISTVSDNNFFVQRFSTGLSADIAFLFDNIPQMDRISFAIACTDMGAGIWGFRTGAKYRTGDFLVFNSTVASLDFMIRADGFKFNLGGEGWFRQTEGMKKIFRENLVGVRTGLKFGDSGDFSFMFGAGIKSDNIEKSDWRLDCAVALPYHSSAEFFTGGLWVSFSYLIGDAYRWEKEERIRKEMEKQAREELERILAEKLALEEEKRRLEEEQKKAMEELKKLKGITVKEEEKKIIIVATETAIHFASGSAELSLDSYETLDQIAAALNAYPNSVVLIEGHTDNVPIGPKLKSVYRNNMELSQARAEGVAQYLMKKEIPEERLIRKGYGETKPVASNATEEGRKKNRRVEIIIQK